MYIVRKITKKTNKESKELESISEHLGFVTTPEEFNIFLNNNYVNSKYAMTPPDIKTYGMGSKAVTIVELSKLNCPMDETAVFTIVSEQDKKLV